MMCWDYTTAFQVMPTVFVSSTLSHLRALQARRLFARKDEIAAWALDHREFTQSTNVARLLSPAARLCGEELTEF